MYFNWTFDGNNVVNQSKLNWALTKVQTDTLPTVATLTKQGLRGEYTLFSYTIKGNKNGFSYLIDNSGSIRAVESDNGNQFYIKGDVRNLFTNDADYSLYNNIELITRNSLDGALAIYSPYKIYRKFIQGSYSGNFYVSISDLNLPANGMIKNFSVCAITSDGKWITEKWLNAYISYIDKRFYIDNPNSFSISYITITIEYMDTFN